MLPRRDLLKLALTLPAAELLGSALPTRAGAQEPSQEKAVASGTVMFADFEGGTWDGWKVEGDAFGTAPATDALFPGKMKGFGGKGFVCTFSPEKGYAATGKATSKEFTIEKPFITFKIGGGKFPSKACLNLVVGGEIVRTETGDGTGRFVDASWDVSELVGKKAHFEIVDATDSSQRGYVIVDDLVLSRQSLVPSESVMDGFKLISSTEISERIESSLDSYLDRQRLPGIRLVLLQNGKIVANIARGVRQSGLIDKIEINDQIMVGSISKPICGYVISRLVLDKKLSWETSLRQANPQLSSESSSGLLDATLADFVCHTSGLPYVSISPIDSKFYIHGKEWRADLIKKILAAPLKARPGEKFEYTCGMDVAAYMAEQITGIDFNEHFKTYVNKELGLRNVRLGIDAEKFKSMPKGHIISRSGDVVRIEDYKMRLKSNTFVHATVGAIVGDPLEIAILLYVAAGYKSLKIPGLQKFLFETSHQCPRPASNYTLSGFGKWWAGLWHGGTHGFEHSNTQIIDKTKSVLLLYTNCNYKEADYDFDVLKNNMYKLILN
jgi:CubicO group peptidase (beta-lactamase class C family)